MVVYENFDAANQFEASGGDVTRFSLFSILSEIEVRWQVLRVCTSLLNPPK